jgi:hypothetical protein
MPEQVREHALAAFHHDTAATPALTLRGADAVDSYRPGIPCDAIADQPTDA